MREGRHHDDALAWGDAPKVLVMTTLTAFAFIFFRATSWDGAVAFVRALFVPGELAGWPVLPTVVLLSCALSHGLERWARPRHRQWQVWLDDRPWGYAVATAFFGLAAGLAFASAGVGGEFIYFQF